MVTLCVTPKWDQDTDISHTMKTGKKYVGFKDLFILPDQSRSARDVPTDERKLDLIFQMWAIASGQNSIPLTCKTCTCITMRAGTPAARAFQFSLTKKSFALLPFSLQDIAPTFDSPPANSVISFRVIGFSSHTREVLTLVMSMPKLRSS